jgi:4-hydroxy-tetrahydrodipicolinate reductase
MRDLIRVLVVGAGRMGSAIVSILLEKEGLEIVGACDGRRGVAGRDLGLVCGLDKEMDIVVESDLARAVRLSRPDLAIQSTGSELTAVAPDIALLVEHGVNVISIAEEMAYPWCQSKTVAERLHELAIRHDAVVLGTGINPGFVFDLLIIALTGVCASVTSIAASRSNDLSPFGPTVLQAQGVGMAPDAFERGVRDGTVIGHVGFTQSMHMIAASLGWQIEEIEQSLNPIISTTRRKSPLAVVEPGMVAGCLHKAVARVGGRAVITLNHPQQVCPEAEDIHTSDHIEIRGVPDICLEGTPEIPGGQGTAAIAVNMIPRVLGAMPGLRTMADLPVPAATHDDLRRFIRPIAERGHG